MPFSRCFILLALPALVAAQTRDPAAIAAALDSRMTNALARGLVAGATVVAVRGRDTLLRRTYGKSDVEANVATPARAVYSVASITKQFTAAAVLKLQEQGKLSIDDPLTKFLPTYPTQGNRVTIRHLLEHTSGIKGMSILHPEFRDIMATTLPRDTLVAIYANKPFDFAPGTAMIYNNTGYVLLGYVIEKASGMSYEAYVKRYLLEPAGMRDSRSCTERDIPRLARGYMYEQNALKPAPYLNYRWGFAVGDLCASAEDLLAWTSALHTGKVLGPAAYKEMLAPGTLSDGTPLRYTKGLQLMEPSGHRAIAHGGDVYGYTSGLIWLPDDSLTIVALVNSMGGVGADDIALLLVRVILGEKPVEGVPFRGKTTDYVGLYRGLNRAGVQAVQVGADSTGALTAAIGEARPAAVLYLGGETFGRGNTRYTFIREGDRVVGVRVDAGTTNTIFDRQP